MVEVQHQYQSLLCNQALQLPTSDALSLKLGHLHRKQQTEPNGCERPVIGFAERRSNSKPVMLAGL